MPATLSPAQQTIFDATNQDRVVQGLSPLLWNAELAAAASAHATSMASSQTLSHQYPGEPDVATRAGAAGAHFRAIAENIAYGPDPRSIERQWMHSVPHRANILDPAMTAIGVGVVERGGYVYAVEDFAQAAPDLAPVAAEQTVEAQLARAGLAIEPVESAGKQAARAACRENEGIAGAHARLVLRWEGADLEHWPNPLTDAVGSGQYTRAAVGACPPLNARNQAFTTYRVAVLLF
ncbi:CAP domain-containing protein [Acidipila sp. EB88]|uniref:CAP domain-containing protein n=1 Tax=Acidipila sp. EB88 TaxID=2305226 RepID=UPI001315812A|nr:CAP domain-containing protein [Acidipila sp. EB88]